VRSTSSMFARVFNIVLTDSLMFMIVEGHAMLVHTGVSRSNGVILLVIAATALMILPSSYVMGHIAWTTPTPRDSNTGIKGPYPCGISSTSLYQLLKL
jgi:hypothetical protein